MLSIREIKQSDIELIVNYWLTADPTFLQGMGVDLNKMPDREQLTGMLSEQLTQSYLEKKSYCIIWLVDNKPVGHCNITNIIFGIEAYMHLHMWNNDKRQKGIGTQLLKMTIPFFFKNIKLKRLYSEPYSLNPAPNKTLEKVGFKFVKEYITIPGIINFEQPVNRWELTHKDFEQTN